MLKPIERTPPRPANPVRRDPDPQFQASVQRALAARAAAENRPPESHGYETAGQVQGGDDLTRLVGSDGVANNGQFPNPGQINPGDIYFQKGPSPVSAQTEGLIDTALAYDRQHGPNAADSQRNWDAVQSGIAGELRPTAQLGSNGQIQLTADQQAKLQALNDWAVGTDRLSLETREAVSQVEGEVQQAQQQAQQQSRNTALDQSITAMQGEIDQVNHKLDDQSFVRKGWGWITPGESAGEEFRDFLGDKLGDLKELKANDTGLPQAQYEQKVNAVLGDFNEKYAQYTQEMKESDETWNTIGEVGRVVAATAVGVVATAATGGNVAIGFGAAFGTYEAIDAAGDINAVVQGEDMYADGHSSIIGFGMDAANLDGAKGDGWGVSGDHAMAALKDTTIDGLSSITTAGATSAGMRVSGALTTRFGTGLATRIGATSAGATTGQVVNGTGQLASDATKLAFDNKLFTEEGGQQMLNSAKAQGIYLATAPVTGAVAGAIPIHRLVSPAANAADDAVNATDDVVNAADDAVNAADDVVNTADDAVNAADDVVNATDDAANAADDAAGVADDAANAADDPAAQSTRLSRLGVTAQFGNDLVGSFGGAELVAQLTEGRHMNRNEAISAAMGALPGTAQNIAMRPDMMARIAARREMLEANGGMRPQESIPDLWRVQEMGPEFRLGAQGRLVGKPDALTNALGGDSDPAAAPPGGRPDPATGQTGANQGADAPDGHQLSQPTLASAGVAVSSKTNVRALGQAVVDSLAMQSFRPLRLALGRELTLSMRPHEHRNITQKELGGLPASNQFVLQKKGSSVLQEGAGFLFATDPAEVRADFIPTVQRVKDVGVPRDQDGNPVGGSHVMELSWGAMLPDAQNVRLEPGEMDLFGTIARADDPEDAFVALPNDMTFTKMMEEQKVTIRPRVWGNLIPGLNSLLRMGGERRPEDNISITVEAGTPLSRQNWDQMRATYDRLSMRTRFVVDDATRDLLLASKPDVESIQTLVATNQINPNATRTYVPGWRSGMRLSAVTGKPAETVVDLFTRARSQYKWHPEAANADFIFNDRYPTERIPGLPDSVANPDQGIANAAYRGRSAINGMLPDGLARVLPRWFGGDRGRTPLERGSPSSVNIYRRLAGPMASFVAEATRFTLSLKAPTLRAPFFPFGLSIEGRAQVKIDPPGISDKTPRGVSRAVRESEMTLHTYQGADGSYRQLPVPGWLNAFLRHSEQGQGVLFPEGGVLAMKQYLIDLHGMPATRQQREALAQFRREFLMPRATEDGKPLPARLDNEKLMTPATIREIRDFLEGQAKPVGTSTPADPMPLWNERRRAGGNG